MDESQDPKPHPHVDALSRPPHQAGPGSPGHKAARKELSIWFFVGLLTLVYGLVLTVQGLYEQAGHEPHTVLANLQPTLWWGVFMTIFGAFYTARFRPGKG